MEKLKALARKLFDRTFLKFLLVGVINTLFGYGIMFGFYNLLGLDYWISSAANYFFGSTLSYFLNKHFTFRDTSRAALCGKHCAVLSDRLWCGTAAGASDPARDGAEND